MILQHPIHYDDFNDDVLSNLMGHGCIRGNWTVVNGTIAEALLRNGELYLDPAATTTFCISTDALESDDLRIEALAVVRGDYPTMHVGLRWDRLYGATTAYLRSTITPSTNTLTSVYRHANANVATFTDAAFAWNVGDQIFFELIAIQRDVTFRTTNLTSGYTTHADYRIPEADGGWEHYAGLAFEIGEQETNHDNSFDYFKVFPAGEPTP